VDSFERCNLGYESAARHGWRGGSHVAGHDGNPAWYILRTEFGRETVAAAHLAGRRFAIYLPMIEGLPLFPGYVFVFVWGLMDVWRRIHAIPGVIRVMVRDERPVVVSNRAIATIELIEARLSPVVNLYRTRGRAKRKGWRKQRIDARDAVDETDELILRCYSALASGAPLDNTVVRGTLARALGLEP